VTYAFRDCRLDPERFELVRDGARVDLQPKVLELLLYLVTRRDRLVSKQELLSALWPGVVVGESSLTRLISLARRAIGDRHAKGSLIQTVSGRGYRFVAGVTEALPQARIARKLAAILSADVVDYSRLMATDEDATIRTLTSHRKQIRVLVEQHGGRVVDFRGDDFLAEFPSALYATGCAVEIQRVLHAGNESMPAERRMQFRIGLHLGDVRVEGEQIFGDGINVASRLEKLAEPGGICISDLVYRQVRRSLDLGYTDLGEQTVKNIPDPIRVYRVELDGGAEEASRSAPAPGELVVPGFAGRPAIAVLPFDNLSDDPDQEYFADGIAEELILRLSHFRWFPVIARSSSFVHKGKASDPKHVGRDLGAGYLVEGSVRRSGDRVRVTAQLIDATTAHHVWGERYDQGLRDVFSLQDEITDAIVAAIEPELWESESELAVHRRPENPGSWDCIQRGWWHLGRSTPEDDAMLRALCAQALELDPQLVRAFYGLATTLRGEALLRWTESLPGAAESALLAARDAVAADEREPLLRLGVASAYARGGHRERMTAALEEAIQLDPANSLSIRCLGLLLVALGRGSPEDLRRADSGDVVPRIATYGLALAHFAAGRDEDAASWARLHRQAPDGLVACGVLAASLAHLGRSDEARALLDEESRRQAEFSFEGLTPLLASAAPEFKERLEAGLRESGQTATAGSTRTAISL
jgi:TolB-like protein/DNA-binding winged helix-turn-helix (wHTH) protein